ncbi:MAG: serine/threonine-protein kinase [Microbacterium sp.]
MDQLRLSGPARPGDVLGGRYRLDELIGEGGMGSVWRAYDTALGRTAAVKVFWSGATDGTDAARRESEKRLLASVSHPSLVTLFDAHLAGDGLSYLVMEHIDGGTLSGLIARGPVGLRDAASLAADLGEALHVVHSAGIIHRDVKPANILLRPPLTSDHTFRAVLADFGIAYVIDATRVTTPGMAIGTAAYISPEQVRGHAPTPASDIYSLGLVLLEALSGRRAFSAQTPVEAISVRLAAAPVIPGEWGYGWRSLLSAMTALDPEARPTALEVSMRGKALDTASTSPAATQVVEVVTAPVPSRRGSASLETRMLPVEHPATSLLAGSDDPTASSHRSARRRAATADRRRTRGVGAAIVVAAAAGVIGLTAWFGATSVPSPTQAPQVESPVESPSDPTPSSSPEPTPVADPVVAPAPVTEPAIDPVAPAGSGVTGSGGGAGNAGPGNNSGSENAGPGNNNGNGNGNGPGDNSGKGKGG